MVLVRPGNVPSSNPCFLSFSFSKPSKPFHHQFVQKRAIPWSHDQYRYLYMYLYGVLGHQDLD